MPQERGGGEIEHVDVAALKGGVVVAAEEEEELGHNNTCVACLGGRRVLGLQGARSEVGPGACCGVVLEKLVAVGADTL